MTKKKLTIAIICDAIDTTLGGSYISAQRFAKWLADEGHSIVRCTSKFIDASRKKDFAYAKLYEFPSLFPLWPQHVRFAYTSASSLLRIFRKEQIDIVYNIHPCYLGRQAYRAARKSNLPIVSHSHIYTELLIPWLPKFLQRGIKNVIARLYRKCDGIIYPTAFAQKDFQSYHFPIQEIVISNGVDAKVFHPLPRRLHDEKLTILFVGRLDPEKNISILIEALHLLPKNHKRNCVIVGGGSEEKKLRTLVDTYKIQEYVHFTGKLSSIDLVKHYQTCWVYVLTSLYELESMTTLEAMSCGCPLLIANSQHSAAKFFVQENGYLFDPHHPKDLADKIKMLMNDPQLLHGMSQKSIVLWSQFSFEKSIQKLEEFFLSFCSRA